MRNVYSLMDERITAAMRPADEAREGAESRVREAKALMERAEVLGAIVCELVRLKGLDATNER
jgi:hypothetical protein